MDIRDKEEMALVREMQDRCKLDEKMPQDKSQRANNNDEYFTNKYDSSSSSPVNGRVSCGSNELSESDECSKLNSRSDNNYPSGRSSVNRDPHGEEMKLPSISSNVVPEVKEALVLVENLRVRFLNSLKEKEEEEGADLYDQIDIDELRKPLPANDCYVQSRAFRILSRYLNFQDIFNSNSEDRTDKEINDAMKDLKEFLKYRHHYQLSRVMADQFAKEFYMMNGCFPFGVDKNNVPLLYLRARTHRRWSHQLDDTFRRYVAWQIDLITKSNPGSRANKTVGFTGLDKDGSFGVCFDCYNVSYSSLDLDFLRFLVRILVQYNPSYCRYALCVDLPWLFRSVWKLVRTWLPEDARDGVQLITAKQLTDFIDPSQIPNCMKINDLKDNVKPAQGRIDLPKNWESFKGIEEFADELNLSSSEIKNFKSHIDKMRKEYDQSCAQ